MTRPRIVTLALSALGSAIFLFLHLPLPFMLGPMAACLVAALGGAKLEGMGKLQPLMRTILGVTIGASITPETVHRLPDMAMSVALVPVFVLLIGTMGYPFFRRVCGYDHPTAFYSCMPGGLQDMLIFGEEAGGNVRTMSLIHATRVLVIVVLIPILMTVVWGYDLKSLPGQPARDLPVGEMLLMAAAGLVGWRVAARVGLFGASILGPLILTAALSIAGFIHQRPPMEAIVTAQFFICMGVGAQYVGVTPRELRFDVSAGVGYCLILAMISLGFAELVSQTGITNPINAFLAFSPGGQSEMAVISIMAGADLAYVVTHHLTRVIIVISTAPLIARRMDRPRR